MNKVCDDCIKVDVCRFKEECMKAVKEIQDIEQKKNVFIKTDIFCKKYSDKQFLISMRQ